MRLLHTDSLTFRDFFDEDTPPYAILSHRWGEEELSYQDFLDGHHKDGEGHQKVLGACNLAKAEHHQWIWIDSICINKASSAELSEAINAMFGSLKEANGYSLTWYLSRLQVQLVQEFPHLLRSPF